MIVRLVVDHRVNGNNYPKGQTVVVTKEVGLKLCEEEIAVTENDVPCYKKKKTTPKKRKKAANMDVKINNEL